MNGYHGVCVQPLVTLEYSIELERVLWKMKILDQLTVTEMIRNIVIVMKRLVQGLMAAGRAGQVGPAVPHQLAQRPVNEHVLIPHLQLMATCAKEIPWTWTPAI